MAKSILQISDHRVLNIRQEQVTVDELARLIDAECTHNSSLGLSFVHSLTI
jgi:hypothetical protein